MLPIDVESHQFLDWVGLERARAIAAKLRDDPGLIEIANANLRRWLARDDYSAGARRSLQEWERLIERSTTDELLAILTDPSETGDRRRQSSPFVGILTREEGMAIYDACEEATIAHPVG